MSLFGVCDVSSPRCAPASAGHKNGKGWFRCYGRRTRRAAGQATLCRGRLLLARDGRPRWSEVQLRGQASCVLRRADPSRGDARVREAVARAGDEVAWGRAHRERCCCCGAGGGPEPGVTRGLVFPALGGRWLLLVLRGHSRWHFCEAWIFPVASRQSQVRC